MTKKVYHILIVDDEAPARRRVLKMLNEYGLTFSYEEAENGLSAIQKIKNNSYDWVLLDIQMPHFTGMEVIREVGMEEMPPVIFLTAYDAFAIQAFEVHAVDYLLKPFDFPRFEQALDRIIAALNQTELTADSLEKVIAGFPNPVAYKTHLWVNKNGSYLPLPVVEIAAFGVDSNYADCLFQGKTYLLRETLQHLEEILDPQYFRRTHRSWIVNLNFIKAVYSKSHGDCTIRLLDERTIPLSRRYRKNLIG